MKNTLMLWFLISIVSTPNVFAMERKDIYGDDTARQNFTLESENFIQKIAKMLAALSDFDGDSLLLIHDSIEKEARELRSNLALSACSNNAWQFGVKRFENNPFRAATNIATDRFDEWRKEINVPFKNFFIHMSSTGDKAYSINDNDFIYKFTLLDNTVACSSLIKELLTVDRMREEQAKQALQRVCISFPKMDIFPLAEDVNIAVLRIFKNELHIGTYLLAVDAGDSDDFQVRGKRALLSFGEQPNAPFTGALIVHSPQPASVEFDKCSCVAFRDFFLEGIKKDRTEDSLLRLLATMRWYKSHAMVMMRGSLSIAEWMEAAMAKSAGYAITRSDFWKKGTVVDGMALSWSLEKFVKAYVENTKFEKIDQ